MSKNIEKVLDLARNEVGYLEKKSNAYLDSKAGNAGNKNFTKYARDLDNLNFYNGKKNGFPWCDVFFDWLIVEVFGIDNALNITYQEKGGLGAGCTFSMNYYKNNNRFYKSGCVGDQIFFSRDSGKTSYHTGLVLEIKDGKIWTIEGNTSSAEGVVENGGAVAYKSYWINYNKICGYGRPNYKGIKEVIELDNIADYYALDAVEKAIKKEILVGDEHGNYHLRTSLTRQDFFVFLDRLGLLD